MIDSVVLARDGHQEMNTRGYYRRLTVHKNVNKQDLHSIQWIAISEERAQSDQRKRSSSSTELETQEILNVVKDRFPCIFDVNLRSEKK